MPHSYFTLLIAHPKAPDLSSCIPRREAEATYAHLLMCDGRALLEDTQCSGSAPHMVFCPRTISAVSSPSPPQLMVWQSFSLSWWRGTGERWVSSAWKAALGRGSNSCSKVVFMRDDLFA